MSEKKAASDPEATHVESIDIRRNGRKAKAECGQWVTVRQLAAPGADPTCEGCAKVMADLEDNLPF